MPAPQLESTLSDSPPAESTAWWSRGAKFLSRHGILLALTVSYAIAFIDRQVLAILQESIRKELHLSDSQLGLLTGFSFALFYALLGLPLGRLADRWNRRNVIAISMVLWSAMTAITGYAQNFLHLLLARIGVAVGEAGVSPSSSSIISDLYPSRHRATAMAFYTIGTQIGTLLGFSLGGWLNDAVGWRAAFLLAGLPGLALALFLLMFVKEPARATPLQGSASFSDGIRDLVAHRTIRRLAPAIAVSALVAYVPFSWAAPYLIRVHHLSTVEVGIWLALASGIGGIIGSLGSNFIADRLGVRDARWYLWLPAIVASLNAPFLWAAFAVPSGSFARALLLFPFAFGSMYAGATLSVVHRIAAPRFRATSTALFYLITNIFGIGLGTWLIGIASDLLKPRFGSASLKYALLSIVPLAAFITAVLYVFASRTINEDVPGDGMAA
jgi:predicted MFS family arabinose efflux permease